MRKVLLIAAVLATVPMLAGCAVFRLPHSNKTNFSMPVGVGGGPDQLKRTPCACAEIPQKAGLPEFLDGEKQPAPNTANEPSPAERAASHKAARGSARA